MTELPGIDVSGIGQGANFNWTAYQDKIAFAFIKATEGATFDDPDFAHNWSAAKALGIVRGAYHFLHAGISGSVQATRFLNVVRPEAGDLLMVDIEQLGTDGGTPAEMSATAGEFADVVRSQTGAWPIAYTDLSMAQDGHCASLGACPFFLANPSAIPVTSAGPWRLISFEQTGQRSVDTDVFYGDLAELRRLAVVYPPPPPPAPAPAPIKSWRLAIINEIPSLAGITSTDGGKTWH